ncbi:hypothetical protein D3C87_2128660 [compost metagenome]
MLEIIGEDADRNAGATGFASRAIGDVLRSSETALGEEIIHFGGARTDQVSEDLALHLARKVGTNCRGRQVELR